MAVYVDPPADWGGHGHPRTSHMVADTDGELHRMAKRIGLKPDRFRRGDDPNQYRRHYVLTPPRRRFALNHGATQISHRDLVTKISQARKRVTTT